MTKTIAGVATILLLLFLSTAGNSYALQEEDERDVREIYSSAIELASKDKLESAAQEIALALSLEPLSPMIRSVDNILNDVTSGTLPRQAALYFFKGLVIGKRRIYVKEIESYTKAIRLAPRYGLFFFYRARAHVFAKELNLAIEDYSTAIKYKPDLAFAYYSRALAYKKAELYDMALIDYTRAIEIDPVFAFAYNNRGVLYMSFLNNQEAACADWKRACDLGLCKNYTQARANKDCE